MSKNTESRVSDALYAGRNSVLKSVFSGLQVWHNQHQSVCHLALAENLKRLPWIFSAVTPLFLVGAWVGWEQQGHASGAYAEFARLYVWVDLGAVAWMLLLLTILVLDRRRARLSLLSRWMPEYVTGQFLLLGLVMSALSQNSLPSASMYVLTCVVSGGLLLVRPALGGCMYAASYGLFFWGIGNSESLPSAFVVIERLYGFAASVSGWVVSLVLWRWFTTAELLRHEVERQSQELAQRNAELLRQQLLLENLAQHDSLTGLLNRRAFTQQAQLALQRASRDGTGVAAVMLDLDYFKRVNDEYGHPAGDEVIRFAAQVVRQCVRETDLAARVGGEEFMLILPSTHAASAVTVAEKIRQQVAQSTISLGNGQVVHITVSAGVTACQGGEVENFETLYANADRALYAAKQAGRNRVEVV